MNLFDMSGWIKIEKALLSDVRFKRTLKRLAPFCNAHTLPATTTETLLLGALAKLWLQADEHIRDDDTMRSAVDDIDDLIGIEDFCSFLPADWFQIVDPDNVHLPDFLAHNGSIAKKRALTQQRVARHRAQANCNASALQVNGSGNADALPDQTRPDQTKPDQKKNIAISATPIEFDDLKAVYPKRAGGQPWPRALKACNARLTQGSTWSEMLEGARRYQRFCSETGKIGTEFVMQAATFFGPDKRFLEHWDLPSNKAEVLRNSNVQASRDWLNATK